MAKVGRLSANAKKPFKFLSAAFLQIHDKNIVFVHITRNVVFACIYKTQCQLYKQRKLQQILISRQNSVCPNFSANAVRVFAQFLPP